MQVLEKDGWFYVRTHGSHHIFAHKEKPGIVLFQGHEILTFEQGL